MEREPRSPKSREVAPCTRPKTAAIFNNTQQGYRDRYNNTGKPSGQLTFSISTVEL